jgi:hypothetical protein
MKKNLRNVLVLGLGLITTIASAQWSASSTSWVDNNDSDARTVDTRSTVTLDMSGVHISQDFSWDDAGNTGTTTYEAYYSTDVMGYGTLTMGRQDLSFGSGSLIGSNNWGNTRHVTNGMNFGMNMAGFDIDAGTLGGITTGHTYVNLNGAFSGVSVNLLMVDNNDVKSSGYDFGYALMDGALGLSYSMNDDGSGSEMTEMGASYSIFDNASINMSMRSYEGDSGIAFTAPMSAWDLENSGDLGHGSNGQEVLSYGLTYDMGAITLSYNMHTTSSEGVDDVEATDMRVSYQLNDNCTIGYRMLSTGVNDINGDEIEHNTVTISIGL